MARPTDEQRREMLVDMVTARIQSQRIWNLQRQGQEGTMAPIEGHEATIVGAVHALDPGHKRPASPHVHAALSD